MVRRPPGETPEQRFKRVATLRANAVLDKLRLLGSCANKRIYNYTDDDVNLIFTAINKQLKSSREKYKTTIEERIELKY